MLMLKLSIICSTKIHQFNNLCISEINQLTNKELFQELFPEVAVSRQGRNSPIAWHSHVQGQLEVKIIMHTCHFVIILDIHGFRGQFTFHISLVIYLWCTHHHTGPLWFIGGLPARGGKMSRFSGTSCRSSWRSQAPTMIYIFIVCCNIKLYLFIILHCS